MTKAEDELRTEIGIIGNMMMIMVLDMGGKVSIPRDRWEEIQHIVLRRVYDEEADADVLEIVTNQGNEVLM